MQRRKRTWFLGLMKTLGQAVNVASFATNQGEDGFIRQVRLTFTIENGSREVVARLNPRDARAYGQAIIDAADRALATNAEQKNGDAYVDHWVSASTLAPVGLGLSRNGSGRRPDYAERVPRLHTYGTYAHTSTDSEEVQVMERTEEAVVVRPLNSDTLIEVPRTESDLRTLTFAEGDWEVQR